MADDTAVESKLANPFASSDTKPLDDLNQRFNELNQSASEWAGLVSTNNESVSEAWAGLLPIIDEMHSLLSQRGSERKKLHNSGLPKWEVWLNNFQEQTGLRVTARTVQKHLAKFRSIGKEKRQRQGRLVKLSSRDQKCHLTAAQCGTELVAALDSGASYHDALQEYKRIAIDSNYIGRLMESLPVDSEPSCRSDTPAGAAAPTSIPVVDLPATSQQLSATMKHLQMPGRGDWSGLFRSVNDSCGLRIKTVLDGLQPEPMADAFGKFVQKLAKTYCHLDDQAIKIRVKVEVIPYNS
jgi:hypothetical protein